MFTCYAVWGLLIELCLLIDLTLCWFICVLLVCCVYFGRWFDC